MESKVLAETIETLTEKLRTLIPELLEANQVPSDPRQEIVGKHF